MSKLIAQRLLAKQYAEILYQQKWFLYAKAAGVFLPDALDDWYFSDEQETFFAQWEKQLKTLG